MLTSLLYISALVSIHQRWRSQAKVKGHKKWANGGGVFIRYSNGQCENHSFPTGKNCTNYRAEAHAVLSAAKILNNSENLSDFTVILSDCKSVLQS